MTTGNVNDNKDDDIKILEGMKEKLAEAFDTSAQLAKSNRKIGCFFDAASFQENMANLADAYVKVLDKLDEKKQQNPQRKKNKTNKTIIYF